MDESCGGLLHLELAENPGVRDRGGIVLRDALTFDRRLVLLSLRATGLRCGWEGSESCFSAPSLGASLRVK